jgi:phage shock protein C
MKIKGVLEMEKNLVGLKIKELRKQRGFSQTELADLCKVNIRTIQRIEAGKVEPHAYTLRQFKKVLNYQSECTAQGSPVDIIGNYMHKIKSVFKQYVFGGTFNMKKENFLHHLRKSLQDRKIAGICGGLGEHTTLPAWLWRVIFLFFAFIYGSGILAYLLLWIFMPASQENYQQHGEFRTTWLNQFIKSEKDKKLAGICGGLGECTSIPSWTWRVMFVGAIFFYGLGMALYVLLWIFVPNEKNESTQNLSAQYGQ